MSKENPSILSHVSIGTNDMERTCAFYDPVMASIGARRTKEVVLEELGLVAVAYGRQFPEFWVNLPENGKSADVANGVHFAFNVPSREAVHAFYDAALAAGATPDGEPGPRPHYGEAYYGCFVLDLDGHKIEAMSWEEGLG